MVEAETRSSSSLIGYLTFVNTQLFDAAGCPATDTVHGIGGGLRGLKIHYY